MRYRQSTDNLRPPDYRVSKYREKAAKVVQSEGPHTESPVVSFVIMAHPKRAEWVETIQAQVPSATVVWDQINDRHDTGLRSIQAYSKDATHHCVIQDDIILPERFERAVTEVCRWSPQNAPIGLYYGAKGQTNSAHGMAAQAAESAGAVWIARKGPIWGPGIVYPTGDIEQLIKFFKNSAVENYDRRVMRYYQWKGVDCWYTYPSLVDHRGENNPSLSGHHKLNRVARKFAGPQGALEVDWSGPIVKAP